MPGSRNKILWTRFKLLGLAGRAGVVGGVVLIAWALMAPVAYKVSGAIGPLAAAVSAAVCLVGAELALVITSLFRGSTAVMYSIVLGMLARTLVPLLLGVVLHAKVPSLAGAGMIFYLLIFYLLTLATETAFMLAHISPASSQKPI